jgi:hypothetical protein
MPATYQGLTLEEWQTEVVKLTEARDMVLRSQDYTVSDGTVQRRNRRAELDVISADLKAARLAVDRLQQQAAGTRRIHNVVPR